MIILSLILGILIASFVEYSLHKIYLHKNEHDHLLVHHKQYLGDSFVQDVKFKDVASSLGYILSNILIIAIICIPIYLYNNYLMYLTLLFSSLYIVWVEWIHFMFHSSKNYFFKKYKIFKNLRNHHYIHHQVFNKNFNIGSNIWDKFLKTLKK